MAEQDQGVDEREARGSWGLHAYGRDGDVEIELLDSIPPTAETWEVQLTVGMFDVGARVDSPATLRELAAFFEQTFGSEGFGQIQQPDGSTVYADEKVFQLGTSGGLPLYVVKDGTYDTRYHIVLGVEPNYLRFTPTLTQTTSFIEALRQLVTEIES